MGIKKNQGERMAAHSFIAMGYLTAVSLTVWAPCMFFSTRKYPLNKGFLNEVNPKPSSDDGHHTDRGEVANHNLERRRKGSCA